MAALKIYLVLGRERLSALLLGKLSVQDFIYITPIQQGYAIKPSDLSYEKLSVMRKVGLASQLFSLQLSLKMIHDKAKA